AEGQPSRATADPVSITGKRYVARHGTGRTEEESRPNARRTDHALRRRSGSVVLASAARRWTKCRDSVLQSTLETESAASRCESRTGSLLRDLEAAGARLALRGSVHPVVARHSALLAHASPPRHAHRQVGSDDRLEREGRGSGIRVPHVPGC